LSPAEAFRLDATRPTPARAQLMWTIAPGYYLYRDRFRFESATGEALPALALPSGQHKDDPYFGPTEIFRDQVVIEIGLDTIGETGADAAIRVISQGCADMGICFPPQSTQLRLATGARGPFLPDGVTAGSAVRPAADARDPLAAFSDSSEGVEKNTLPFIRVGSNTALDALLAEAKRRGVPAMLDFYAAWCIPCREMETRTLSMPAVRDALADSLLLRVDLSSMPPSAAPLLARFGLERPPAILFFDRRGEERIDRRVVGFMESGPFAARVRQATR